MNTGWAQFLFVAVPVLSLVGAWMALKASPGKRRPQDKDNRDNT
jgi:hypothetical protein